MFRFLKANEIDCFPKMVKKDGCLILLYKDARCDMNILDETVGNFKWKREHSRDNANCTVSIYSDDLQQWVGKEDTGTQSNQDKEKGLASDSFKRACFNWGIGRELYTTPFIWIPLTTNETYCTNPKETQDWQKKYATDKKLKFEVSHILTVNGEIKELKITDQNGKVRFELGKYIAPPKEVNAPPKKEIVKTHHCVDCKTIITKTNLAGHNKDTDEYICKTCLGKRNAKA